MLGKEMMYITQWTRREGVVSANSQWKDMDFDVNDFRSRYPEMTPYIGDNYGMAQQHGSALLVIGESHYLPEYSNHSQGLRHVVYVGPHKAERGGKGVDKHTGYHYRRTSKRFSEPSPWYLEIRIPED